MVAPAIPARPSQTDQTPVGGRQAGEEAAGNTGVHPAFSAPDPLEFSDAEAAGEEESASSSIQDEVEQQETVEQAPAAEPEAPVAGPAPVGPRHGVPLPPSDGNPFPTSPIIEQQQQLWVRVFSRLGSDRGVIHDGRRNDPIYEELDLSGLKPKEQRQFIKHRLAEVAAYLRDLADAIEQNKEPDEQARRLRSHLSVTASPDEIRESSRNLRFQRGLADRFEAGVVRSGAFEAEIRKILNDFDVPEELVNLPHVESSYNNATRSRAGAVGIWQFTRGTGKLFMTVDNEVDERLDPLIAARAAAKFLRQNYERLGTWPLAITAYNHGPQSLERIVSRMGTTDLGYLIEHYDGPLFKFASKNFYAEFLAARHVAENFVAYFGDLERRTPYQFARVELPFFLEFERAVQLLGVSKSQLAELNPSLRRPVLTGTRYIPKGFQLRLPARTDPRQFIAEVPASARMPRQKTVLEVQVTRGDTLYSIGRRYNVPWMTIAALNNISPRSRLMPGQRLIMPGHPNAQTVAQSTATMPAAPSSAPAEASRQPPSLQPVQSTVTATANEAEPALAHLAAVAARKYSYLAMKNYDSKKRLGKLQAAYGETVGHYADWARVTAQEIREANGLHSSALQPGRTVIIPMGVDPDEFSRQRMAFHQQREESFFSAYEIADTKEVKLQKGQTVWNVAQSHGVPMWLLYRENPVLLQRPAMAGTRVSVPILRELAAVSASRQEQ
jgi:membrane-bound lytic murein transglycosylase D